MDWDSFGLASAASGWVLAMSLQDLVDLPSNVIAYATFLQVTVLCITDTTVQQNYF